jgi:hypothetical protein
VARQALGVDAYMLLLLGTVVVSMAAQAHGGELAV